MRKEIDWNKKLEQIKKQEEIDKAFKETGALGAAVVIIGVDLLFFLPMLYLGGYFDERMNIVKWIATVFVIVCEIYVILMNMKDPSNKEKEGDS